MVNLTLTEQKVLKLLVKGYSNPKIAKELCVTETTIKAHISNILKKLHLKNRVQIVVFALKNELIKYK